MTKKIAIKDAKDSSNKAPEDDAPQAVYDENSVNGSGSPDHGEAEKQPEDLVCELQQRIDDAIKEKDALNDRLLRLAAEFENYKKRMDRQWADFKKYANESLIRELLSVVDNLERAVACAAECDAQDNPLVSGVEMTLKELQRILEKFGVAPIDSIGKPFDPAVHEAVARKESDDLDENTIMEEYQKGYMIHDRLLRPSMVVVSSGAKAKEEKDTTNNE